MPVTTLTSSSQILTPNSFFQPESPSPSLPPSLFLFAKNTLIQLQKKALERANDNDVDGMHIGQTAEEERLHPLMHQVSLSFAESELSKEYFYALSELIDASVGVCKEKHKKSLEFGVRQAPENLVVWAEHSSFEQQLAKTKKQAIKAPIAKLPFTEFQDELSKLESMLSDNWKPSPKLGFVMQEDGFDFTKSGMLFNLQKACREIRSDFALSMKKEDSTLYVKEAALNDMKKILSSPVEFALTNTISTNTMST